MILDSAVSSRFLAQALVAPSQFKKLLITNKVTTHFLNSLCTSISCTIKSNLTADSRMIVYASELAESRFMGVVDLFTRSTGAKALKGTQSYS